MLMHALSALLIALVVLTGAARAEPEVFSKAGYEADRAAAIEGEKLHVLYFTASWCPPCQQMKKTTWVDESVVSWLNENAVVSAFDVDRELKLVYKYGIFATPTIILIQNNSIVDYKVGYLNAEDATTWFRAHLSNKVDTHGEHGSKAEKIIDIWLSRSKKKIEQAFEDGNMVDVVNMIIDVVFKHDPSYTKTDIIYDYFATTVMLATSDENAAQVLKTERETRVNLLKSGQRDHATLREWLFLNKVLGDQVDTVEWAKRISKRGSQRHTLRRYSREILRQADVINEMSVYPLVIEKPAAEVVDKLMYANMLGQLDALHAEMVAQNRQNDYNKYATYAIQTTIEEYVLACIYAETTNVVEHEFLDALSSYFGDNDIWRIAYMNILEQHDMLKNEHIDWIELYDLRDRYPKDDPWPDEIPGF